MDAETYKNLYRVASARWAGYDYGQNGAYFITICTKDRQRFFGEIILPDGHWETAVLQESLPAQVARQCWAQISERFPFVVLDAFVIMPDHVHGLLLFDKPTSLLPPPAFENRFGPQRDNLAAVVRGFKAGVTSRLQQQQQVPFAWQPRFHDRVVRNSQEQEKIQRYIAENPARWKDESGKEDSLFR
ncbi:transposase [Hymenobacter sp. B1770]|uniref:transposase n=1 Tax=Hymenobacter sp. B1770 TaxID=1718788 RepID=UPI003CF11CFC